MWSSFHPSHTQQRRCTALPVDLRMGHRQEQSDPRCSVDKLGIHRVYDTDQQTLDPIFTELLDTGRSRQQRRSSEDHGSKKTRCL